MRALLHVGLHKTGTTSIQAFLRDKEQLLRENGWLFPNGYLQLNCHFELPIAQMRPDRLSPSRSKGDDWRDAGWRQRSVTMVERWLDKQQSAGSDLRPLLSCEEFSLYRFDDELKALRDVVGDAEIIFCRRDVHRWLAELDAEQDKIGFGSSDDPEAYNYLEPDSWICDHEARADIWRNHFTKVRIIDFDTALEADGSVVPEFCRLLGIEPPEDALSYWLNVRGSRNDGRVPGTYWGGGVFGSHLTPTIAWQQEFLRRRALPVKAVGGLVRGARQADQAKLT